jgi:hypothetical protein
MSAIFITKSLQTMVKGPSRRRLWMYTEKKIVDVQREEDYGCTPRRRLYYYYYIWHINKKLAYDDLTPNKYVLKV